MPLANSTCTLCQPQLVFNTKGLYKQHMENVHYTADPNGERSCIYCNKIVKNLYEHVIHQHFSHNLPNFVCTFCSKTFKKKALLKRHMQTHSTEKPYKCEHTNCGKAFKNQSQLYNHIQRVHFKQTKHKCTICDKTFTRIDNMKRHQTRVHTDEDN